MIETRPTSALTRLALAMFVREQQALVLAASQADGTPLTEGWLLNADAGHWQRDVPDMPPEAPPAPSSENGERTVERIHDLLDKLEHIGPG